MHQSLLAIVVVLFTCGSALAADNSMRLKFDHVVDVAVPTSDGLGQKSSVPAGQEIPVPLDKAFWVQAKGKVPVLLLPQIPSNVDTSKLHLPDVAEWPPQLVEKQIEAKLSVMIEDILLFQAAIRKRDVKTAETILGRLQSTQDVAYLSFLRASLDFVKGDMESAKNNVKRGLQRHPANEQGLQMLKVVEGQKQ